MPENAAVTSATFKPTFQSGIQVLGGGYANNINPMFCASQQSAIDLAVIIADLKPVIVQDWPMNGWPAVNQDTQSAKVPYFEFTSLNVSGLKVRINVGFEIWIWNHGYPAAYCESACRQDILETIMQAEAAANGN